MRFSSRKLLHTITFEFSVACIMPITHNLQRDKDKFASRSRWCLFVGYPFGWKGWKLYDLDTHEYFVSRDVVFAETEFPFSRSMDNVVVDA